MTTYTTGKDMLLLPDGSTYHLGAKAGDIYPRILTVGSQSRAAAIATLLDATPPVKQLTSSRQFHIFSGNYNGVGVSIIAIGMGAPMMDFMVREASYILQGPMAVIRLGTCGLFKKEALPGTVVTAGKGSMYVYVNYAQFSGCANDDKITKDNKPYLICKPVPCNSDLNSLLMENLKSEKINTFDGLNACAETFYACQGRKDPNFKDNNEDIVDVLLANKVDFVEMETHQLFHLASIKKDKCATAACAIGIVNRTNPEITDNISADVLHEMEKTAGKACLKALVEYKL